MTAVSPSTVIGKYQIIKRLGGGAFGDVYHAFDLALRVEKAVKILNPVVGVSVDDQLAEARVLAECTHKHIVSINEANVYDIGGQFHVVLDLEYIPEGSLESAMQNRWLSLQQAIGSVRGALLGLEFAHSSGFIHRDVKPGNIMLSPNCAKLSDFGLATQVGSQPAGVVQGYTPHLPPEFFVNGRTSEQSDVYGAGITLFRAVNSIRDWRAVLSATPDVQRHIENGTLVKTIGYGRHVPDSVRRIINKACAARAASRYQSAGEFGQKLDGLRFGIQWVKAAPDVWIGVQGSLGYSASVDSRRNEVVVKKNGRRVNSLCSNHASHSDAMESLEDYVSRSSLT